MSNSALHGASEEEESSRDHKHSLKRTVKLKITLSVCILFCFIFRLIIPSAFCIKWRDMRRRRLLTDCNWGPLEEMSKFEYLNLHNPFVCLLV